MAEPQQAMLAISHLDKCKLWGKVIMMMILCCLWWGWDDGLPGCAKALVSSHFCNCLILAHPRWSGWCTASTPRCSCPRMASLTQASPRTMATVVCTGSRQCLLVSSFFVSVFVCLPLSFFSLSFFVFQSKSLGWSFWSNVSTGSRSRAAKITRTSTPHLPPSTFQTSPPLLRKTTSRRLSMPSTWPSRLGIY